MFACYKTKSVVLYHIIDCKIQRNIYVVLTVLCSGKFMMMMMMMVAVLLTFCIADAIYSCFTYQLHALALYDTMVS